MNDLRNKMEDSTISAQLDVVIAQKEALASIDRYQMANLNEILDASQSILSETRSLLSLIEVTLSQVVPLNAGDKVYDFSSLTKLENVWKSASDKVDNNEIRMKELKAKFDSDRLNKLMLLGEPVPDSLQYAANQVEKRALAAASSANVFGTENSIVPSMGNQAGGQIVPVRQIDELTTKDEGEIAGVLAAAVGKAAVASGKASFFGIKALFETFKTEEVTQVTGEVVKSSSDISKVSSGLSESVKNVSSGGDLKNVVNDDLKSGFKSTGDTLGAIGKVGQVFANKVTTVNSASQANEALRETSNDIVEAFNAVSALSKKLLKKKGDSPPSDNGPPLPPAEKM